MNDRSSYIRQYLLWSNNWSNLIENYGFMDGGAPVLGG